MLFLRLKVPASKPELEMLHDMDSFYDTKVANLTVIPFFHQTKIAIYSTFVTKK